MKHSIFNQAFTRLFTLIALCITSFGFTSNLGMDSYEIYLNKKLVLKQNINQSLDLRILQLSKTNDKDMLHITYTHCTVKGAGTERRILIKDEKGVTLKKFEFANATGSDFSMTIPAKALLHLEKVHAGHSLSMHYAARELDKGETLAFLQFK